MLVPSVVDISKTETLNLNQTSGTSITLGVGKPASDSAGFIYVRGFVSYYFSSSSGFVITSAGVDAECGGTWTSSNSRNVQIISPTLTLSSYTYNSTPTISVSYPKGQTFKTTSLSNSSFQSITSFKVTNGTIKATSSQSSTPVTIKMSMKVDDGSSFIQVPLTFKFTLTIPKTQYTLTYLKENGSTYGTPITRTYNSTITVQSGYSKSPSQGKGSGEYIITFNTNGGTAINSRSKPWSWSNTTTYEFSSWGGYPPGTTYIFRSDTSLKAVFRSSTSATTWSYQTFGSLPTTYKKGYESTNVWYYPNGTIVDSGDEVKSSVTVYCKWENPKTYQINFNLNGGKIPEEYDQSIKNYSLSKMYGASVKAPSFTPYRLGYSFSGWSNQTGSLAKVQPNGNIDDRYYNEVNGDQTNINVTLYAQWTPKVNTIKFRYYLTDDGELKTDTITYTIERVNKIVTKNAPNSLRGGDFAFLGWCDQKPRGWDKSSYANNGYHGTYTLPPEKVVDEDGNEIDVELPVTIDINKLTKLEDWGVTEEYYGIWAKSGKYIKISNAWRKVVRSYVKINGEWKLVRDIWTKQGGTWKHEI